MIPAKNPGFLALGWWRALQPDPASKRPGDRAALARLRRYGAMADAMQDEAALGLFRALKATAPDDLPSVGLAAAVLAHVREDRPGTVARCIGPDSLDKPETALVKPLRFRRVMEADGPDERLLAFRRLAAIARGALPVQDLAAALLDWSDQRRTRWVFDYWNAQPPDAAASPAPSASPAKDAMP